MIDSESYMLEIDRVQYDILELGMDKDWRIVTKAREQGCRGARQFGDFDSPERSKTQHSGRRGLRAPHGYRIPQSDRYPSHE